MLRSWLYAKVLLLLLLPGQAAQLTRIEITGTVIDSVSGKPIAGVLVTSRLPIPDVPSPRAPLIRGGNAFVSGDSGQDSLGRPILQTTTDAQGYFSVGAVPGRSTLVFGKDNYGVRTLTYIVAGNTFQAHTVRLSQNGVISGRVFDARNNPAPSVTVTAYTYNEGTVGRGFSRYPATRTDDRGEFRLSGLAANSYVLVFSGSGGSAFYPGVVDYSKTERVVLTPGKEVRLSDIVLSSSVKQGKIHVDVINGAGDGPKDLTYTFASATAGMEPPGLDGNSFFSVSRSSSRDPVIHLEANEARPFSHEVSGIGSYRATATWKDAIGNAASATVRTEFFGEDVQMKLVLKTPDGRLACRVLLEAEDGTFAPLAGVNIILESASGRNANCISGADGAAEIPTLDSGKYRFSAFQRTPVNTYPASVRHADREVSSEEIEVTSERSTIEVRFRRGAGVVRGVVTDRNGRPIHDAVVAAISDVKMPTEISNRPYLSSRSGQDGSYEIRGFPPGNYRLVAWSVLEDSVLTKEFLESFAAKGTPIAMKEKDVVLNDLKASDEQ